MIRNRTQNREDREAKPPHGNECYFSVATYNIHRCMGMDRSYNPERIVDVIRELDADVVGLQEVVSLPEVGRSRCIVDFLSHAVDLTTILGPTRWGGRYGNALLTSHRVLDVRRVDLSVPGREPRGAMDVKLDIRGSLVRVIVAHLGLKAAERRHQIEHLLDLLSDGDGPVVMLGDFNEWLPRRRPIHWLNSCLGMPPRRLTFPSRFPVLALDRIWVRPLDALMSIRVHNTALSRIASDHLPLKATVALERACTLRSENGSSGS